MNLNRWQRTRRHGFVVSMVCALAAGSVLVEASPSSAAAASSGVMTTVAGGGTTAALANGVSALSVALGSPVAAVPDSHGNVAIADQANNVIRVVAGTTGTWYGHAMTAGRIYTVVGNGTDGYLGDSTAIPLTSAELSGPNGVAVDAQGDIAITDTGNQAVRFVAATGGTRYGLPMTAGEIYTIAGGGSSGQITDGGFAFSAGLADPDGIAFDAQGDVVVADTTNDVVRLIPPSAHTLFGRTFQPLHIYTLAGNTTYGYTGNGGPAAAAEVSLEPFAGVAVDPAGNVAIADADNEVVRMVAAATGSYHGRLVTAGDIYTIAGNGIEAYAGNKKSATLAELDTPQGVAYDPAGNLLIGDSLNDVVRLVAANNGSYGGAAVKAGDIYTVAGNHKNGYAGDGGPTTSAELNGPTGVSADASGHVVITDNGNDVIREIKPPFPSVTTVKPALGPSSGGRKVTIKGANLSGATSVLFGSRPATSFVVKSAKRIVAFSPSSLTGKVTIVVNTPAGSSLIGATDSYTYVLGAPVTKHRH